MGCWEVFLLARYCVCGTKEYLFDLGKKKIGC